MYGIGNRCLRGIRYTNETIYQLHKYLETYLTIPRKLNKSLVLTDQGDFKNENSDKGKKNPN